MVSPRLAAAAASTRTEDEVRASRPMSMLDVIQAGAQNPTIALPCPFCGADPLPPTIRAGRFLVACTDEECPANPQTGGDTAAEALAAWNRRVA